MQIVSSNSYSIWAQSNNSVSFVRVNQRIAEWSVLRWSYVLPSTFTFLSLELSKLTSYMYSKTGNRFLISGEHSKSRSSVHNKRNIAGHRYR